MTKNIEIIYQAFCEADYQINTDTRKEIKGAFFICLVGEVFDANAMAEEAKSKGARYVLTNRKDLANQSGFIFTEDTLKAMQDLANYHRKQFNIPVIAIGGSNGKTTTKELMASVFKKHYNTHVTPGNFNNHIGVPLTLLQLRKEHEMALVELGINHPEEMTLLCEIAAPTEGVLTNIGKEHLEGFGSIEGVAKAESELFDYLLKNEGLCYINSDDVWLNNMAKRLPKTKHFGLSMEGINIIMVNPSIAFEYHGVVFKSSLSGTYNLSNIIATIAIAEQHEIPIETIAAGIFSYVPSNNRSQWKNTAHNQVLMDCYNANPSSMQLAIENFYETPAAHKLFLVGDMLELGSFALTEHQAIVDLARTLKDDNNKFVFVGETFEQTDVADTFPIFSNTAELNEKYLTLKKPKNQLVLLKASRGIKLEQALPNL